MVDPQFEYANYATTVKNRSIYDKVSDELLTLSIKILNSFIDCYGSETRYLLTEGDTLS